MDPVKAASEGASEGAVGAALEAFFGPAVELSERGRTPSVGSASGAR